MPEPLVIATIAMAIASIVISALSIRWSVKSARILRDLERRRVERERARAELNEVRRTRGGEWNG